jgi:hypothetical protein
VSEKTDPYQNDGKIRALCNDLAGTLNNPEPTLTTWTERRIHLGRALCKMIDQAIPPLQCACGDPACPIGTVHCPTYPREEVIKHVHNKLRGAYGRQGGVMLSGPLAENVLRLLYETKP